MSRERPLRGGCSCGRNAYVVEIPAGATEVAQVFFDRSTTHPMIGRSQASPLSAWLRVPLEWYHSTTYAFFDDETHSAIRRVYTSPLEQNAKRHFCGFCGTPLSYWSETPPTEANFICLTLGSLQGADLRDLDELGLLPKGALRELDVEDETTIEQEQRKQEVPADSVPVIGDEDTIGDRYAVVPWFETMLQGSSLGRIRRSKGTRQTQDGSVRVEWEIVELLPEEGVEVDTQASGKRKLGDIESNDAVMDEGQ